jgi:4a-hydroxytetrahydrobiopterin dehydratase
MAGATRLDATAVGAALQELGEWSGDTTALERSVKAPSFLAGIELVKWVANAAEELDHHPDIDIRWRTVTFRLQTHVVADKGPAGVTENDLELARRIDDLVLALL